MELGLLPPSADQGFSPRKAGFVTMCSFMAFGAIPLLPYLVALIPGVTMSTNLQLFVAVFSTIITLFILGAYKSPYTIDRMAPNKKVAIANCMLWLHIVLNA